MHNSCQKSIGLCRLRGDGGRDDGFFSGIRCAGGEGGDVLEERLPSRVPGEDLDRVVEQTGRRHQVMMLGWMDGCMDGWLVGWLVARLVGRSLDWLGGWLLYWLVSR